MNDRELKRIANRILYLPADHTTDRPILAAISGTERTLLMDAGNSPAHAALFLEKLAAHDLPRIDLRMITHWHWDHIFGMSCLNVPTIAHTETKRQMETMLDWEWTDEALDDRVRQGIEIPFCADMIKKEFLDERDINVVLPTILFQQKLEIDLGGVTCVIEHVGGDHAHDSSVLYVKEEKTLFLGDCMGPAIYCPERYYTGANLLPLLSKLESYDAETYVSSHGGPMTRSEMETELHEMRTLVESTREHHGRKEDMIPDLVEKWGRELREDDYPFMDWFITGYKLEYEK